MINFDVEQIDSFPVKYKTWRLRVVGHANENGGDPLVCAAVSAIVYSLAGWIEKNKATMYGNYIDQSGDFYAEVIGDEKAAAVFDLVMTGLRLIAHKYPDQISEN